MLYIVPTPIGNLADMTYRAVTILQSVDTILAEDTRTSGVLLKHYNISKPMFPYHQHNEHKITERLVQELQAGKTMALLTDAGTPGISDPAFFHRSRMRQTRYTSGMPSWSYGLCTCIGEQWIADGQLLF
jgi:16S rRNA (cytidine(1402)-2'-O)-methyltransferase